MAKKLLLLIRLALLATLLAEPAVARAGAVEDLLDAAREAFEAGQFFSTMKYAKRAEKVADEADQVLSSTVQARIWYYQGVAQWSLHQQDEAMDSWRQALLVDMEFAWETASMADTDAEAVFESLRREVRSRDTVDLGVPASTGATKIYVAGRAVSAGQRITEGRYLLQALCSDGVIYSRWWKFGKPPRYENLCPNGFGEAPEHSADESTDLALLFDDFGNPITPGGSSAPPVLDSPVQMPSGEPPELETPTSVPSDNLPVSPQAASAAAPVVSGQEPDVTPAQPGSSEGIPSETGTVQTVASGSAEKPGIGSAGEETIPDAASAASAGDAGVLDLPRGRSTVGRVLLYGGVGALAAGTGMNFLLVNPAWQDVRDANADPSSVTIEQADYLEEHFNLYRYLTLGVLGVGVAAVGTSVLLDSTVLGVGPGTLFLTMSI